MMFVDGENFSVALLEVLLDAFTGREENYFLRPEGDFKKGVFLWTPRHAGRPTLSPLTMFGGDMIRAYFYTSDRGSDEQLSSLAQTIRAHEFDPCVFKKPDKTRPAKGVDIALARDMLVHAIDNHYDAAYLLAGDGDYEPLIDEVKRRGKHVFIGYFAGNKALNLKLKLRADRFYDLADYFRDPWRSYFSLRRE